MYKKLSVLVLLIGLSSTPAFAVSKEIIQLQQQVALLMNQVQDLQNAFTSNIAVIKSLLSQNTDTVNKLTLTMANIQQTLNGQNSSAAQNQTAMAQQFQAMSDSLDELRGRMSRMEDVLKQVQQAQQTIQSAPAPAPAPGGVTAPAAGGNGAVAPNAGGTAAANPAPTPAAASPAPARNVLPASVLFQNALSDYVSGSYPLAKDEFRQYLANYPDTQHDAEAAYYLGDIYSKERDYKAAIDLFNTVINHYPRHQLTPGAHLKKGYALLAMGRRTEGIRELRRLIALYPTSQEARQAKEQLRVLGVSYR